MLNIHKIQFIPQANSEGIPSLDDLLVSHKIYRYDENKVKHVFYEFKPAERKYYLYRHIRLDKNEVFYVGIGTKNLKKNYLCETTEYERAFDVKNRNKYWNNIVNKTDYRVEILLENLKQDEVFLKEKEFIALYGRKILDTGTLCNITQGGEGKSYTKRENAPYKKRTFTPSPESIKRGADNRRGKPLLEETKRKISETLKQKHKERFNPFNVKPIYTNIKQFDKDWNLLKIWENAGKVRDEFSNFVVKTHVNTGVLYKNFYWVI